MATQQGVELYFMAGSPVVMQGEREGRRDGVLQHGLRRHGVSQSE